jgi:hypothetical protein
MEAERSSETSVDIQLRTLQYIPEYSELYTPRRENLKSHNFVYNSIYLLAIYTIIIVIIIKFGITIFNWYGKCITLKPQFQFVVYLLKLFWILEILTQQTKILEVLLACKCAYI